METNFATFADTEMQSIHIYRNSLNPTSSPADLGITHICNTRPFLEIYTSHGKSYNHHILILHARVLNTCMQLVPMRKKRHLPQQYKETNYMEGVWLVGAEASNHYRGKQKMVHAGSQPTHHFNNKVIKPKVLLERWFPKNRPIKVSQQVGIEHCKS